MGCHGALVRRARAASPLPDHDSAKWERRHHLQLCPDLRDRCSCADRHRDLVGAGPKTSELPRPERVASRLAALRAGVRDAPLRLCQDPSGAVLLSDAGTAAAALWRGDSVRTRLDLHGLLVSL